MTAELNLDRDVGLQVRSEDIGGVDRMRYMLGIFLGQGRNSLDPTNKGFLYVGRFEVHPLGAFESDSEADLERMRRPGLSIGAAYAYHDDAPGERGVHGSVPADGGTTDIHSTTADLMVKYRGFSLTSALHLRKARRRNPGGALDRVELRGLLAIPGDEALHQLRHDELIRWQMLGTGNADVHRPVAAGVVVFDSDGEPDF